MNVKQQIKLLGIMILLTFPTKIICSNIFSYGIKGGASIGKFALLNSSRGLEKSLENSYPIGYSLGIFVENKLSENLSIINELIFQNNIKKSSVYTFTEGILEQELNTTKVNIVTLLKYQTALLWDAYFLGGFNIGYINDINYQYHDLIYSHRGIYDLTNELTRLNIEAEIGIGEIWKLQNSAILVELRAQFSLTRFEFSDIGKWNDAGIRIIFGYQLF